MTQSTSFPRVTLAAGAGGAAMNQSGDFHFVFACNVSPSAELDITVTKREPMAVAVPMTIFYSTVFLLGVRHFTSHHFFITN